MSSFSKTSPKADRAERNIIGSCLIDPDLFANLVGRVKSEDFYHRRHALIWNAMYDVFNEGKEVNLITVGDKSTHDDSVMYLVQLMNECPSTRYIDEWVHDLLNTSKKRKLLLSAGRIAAAVYEESEFVDAADRARALLDEVTGESEGESLISPTRQAELLREYIESRKDNGASLIRTGYPTLDQYCGGGLRRGDLIIVAARTSVGKSTYAENIAENVAKGGKRVLFVSVEMTPQQMLYRYAVRSGQLPHSVLEFGIFNEQEDELVNRIQEMRKELPFYIHDAPGATVTNIRAQVSRLASQGPLGLVVVDYLQIMDSGNDKDGKEHLRIGQITKSLKHLAREFDVPIILISQLNRNIEYRGGEPKLADLRESGRIEEDADLILMLWEVENADVLGNVTRLKLAKNRQGPSGTLPIRFNKQYFTFTEPVDGSGSDQEVVG